MRGARDDAQEMLPTRRALIAGSAVAVSAVAIYFIRRRRYTIKHVEWWRLSAVDAVAALKAKRVTPSELLESAISRVGVVEAAGLVKGLDGVDDHGREQVLVGGDELGVEGVLVTGFDERADLTKHTDGFVNRTP